MKKVILLMIVIGMVSCKSNSQQINKDGNQVEKIEKNTIDQNPSNEKETSFTLSNGEVIQKVNKPSQDWKKALSDKEYYVLREKGTERSFTSNLLNIKDSGTYSCKACGLALFASETKYKSGTGWPSFYQPVDEQVILEDTDYDLGYARTEVMCRRCEGHLGHVFKDGPEPTGLRYCINGVSLDFKKEK